MPPSVSGKRRESRLKLTVAAAEKMSRAAVN
jgi:hypothetical protein